MLFGKKQREFHVCRFIPVFHFSSIAPDPDLLRICSCDRVTPKITMTIPAIFSGLIVSFIMKYENTAVVTGIILVKRFDLLTPISLTDLTKKIKASVLPNKLSERRFVISLISIGVLTT